LSTPARVEQQKRARQEATRFLDSQVGEKNSITKGLQFDSPAKGQEADDAWWKAEETRWKAELELRRENGQEGQPETFEPTESTEPTETTAVGEGPEDICLRSQVVVKSPHDAGLGIQLVTPPTEQGVRITKIDPFGPFGRTGAFEDGDVIVEVDGTPLLYGGHAAVLAAISEAMRENSEMVVTVCSASELAKLEALVDVDDADSNDTETALKPKADDWKGKLLKSVFSAAASAMTIKPSKKKSSDGVVGSLSGAPAWWGDKGSKQQTAAKPTAAVKEETARPVTDQPHTEPAYLIYRAEIRDLEAYRNEYMCKTTELIQQYGGRWLARGGKVESLEGGTDGETVLQRMVLIEFPSMDAAKAFFRSTEYQEARQARLAIATAELTVLEGMKASADPMP
jgi:uncharacterized protein (DUF1330 family)